MTSVIYGGQLVELRRDFPSWRIWVSSAGRLWAQQRRDYEGHEYYADADADSISEMRRVLTVRGM